jgi:dihydrofolate reductase
VIGANLVQQCIRAGLLDELHVDMVPVVLGGGQMHDRHDSITGFDDDDLVSRIASLRE